MPLETIISTIATPLSITSVDVYILFSFLIFLIAFALLGIERIYATFFGVVLGIGIFVLLSTLLSPQYQTAETQKLIGETLAQTIIWSSIYLIFILGVLVPINGNLALTYPRNPIERIIQTLLLALGLFLFASATVLGLIERSYIFINTNSAFSLLKSTLWYTDFQASRFYVFLLAHVSMVLLLGIGFIIYKLLFADIVNTIVASIMASIKRKQAAGAQWHEDHQEYGWHEEAFDEQEMYEAVHGHGHHGH